MSTDGGDFLVVGAGIIGCAVARELASRGARVHVLEPRGPAMGATQASAGVLAPYIEAHDGGPLLDLALRSLDLYDRWMDDVRRESGVDVEYRRSGSLEVAQDGASATRLRDVATRFGSAARLDWLDGGAAREREPALSPGVFGGLSVPAHGYVAAQALTMALARAATTRGAALHAATPVARIEPAADMVVVTAASGREWRVGRVIVAAGSWTGIVAGALDAAAADVHPVRGQLLRVAWRGRPLTQVVWGASCYLVPWRDGTVLVGATMEDVGFEERNTVAGVRGLLDAARALVPAMEDATFLDARAGLRPATSDGLPIIGPSERSDRIVYASGHYRNGILLAPLTAALVAGLVLDGRHDQALDVLSPARMRKPAAHLEP